MAAQKAGKASLVTVDAGVPPVRADKKMAALMAAGKEDAAWLVALDAGSSLGKADEKMAAPMVTQKAGEASPAAVQ
jgi:hypothetical protein